MNFVSHKLSPFTIRQNKSHVDNVIYFRSCRQNSPTMHTHTHTRDSGVCKIGKSSCKNTDQTSFTLSLVSILYLWMRTKVIVLVSFGRLIPRFVCRRQEAEYDMILERTPRAAHKFHIVNRECIQIMGKVFSCVCLTSLNGNTQVIQAYIGTTQPEFESRRKVEDGKQSLRKSFFFSFFFVFFFCWIQLRGFNLLSFFPPFWANGRTYYVPYTLMSRWLYEVFLRAAICSVDRQQPTKKKWEAVRTGNRKRKKKHQRKEIFSFWLLQNDADTRNYHVLSLKRHKYIS